MTLTILTKPEWTFAWEYGLSTAAMAMVLGVVIKFVYTFWKGARR